MVFQNENWSTKALPSIRETVKRGFRLILCFISDVECNLQDGNKSNLAYHLVGQIFIVILKHHPKFTISKVTFLTMYIRSHCCCIGVWCFLPSFFILPFINARNINILIYIRTILLKLLFVANLKLPIRKCHRAWF